jgi:hypothetical protein
MFKAGKPTDPMYAMQGCGAPPPLDANGDTLMDQNGQWAANDTLAANKSLGLSYNGAWVTPKPLLSQYPAAFGGKTIFSLGHSAITVDQTELQLEGAKVTIPNFLNPWAACDSKQTDAMGNVTCDPSSSMFTAAAVKTLVPWAPQQPGIGFEFPSNGQSDIAVQTAQIDFTGVLEEYTVDYWPYKDPAKPSCETDGMCHTGYTCTANACVASDNSIQIVAIEAHDFLGEVFMCQDPLTGDLLRIRMYSSAHDILEWLANHPGDALHPAAQTQCNIIVRYSPYNNYPDYITSLANGVKVNTNQGMGYGRIVDATLFDTNVEALQ